MSATTGSWRASLRIARRDAWRHRGRSALVLALIGLPVAILAFGSVAFRTFQSSQLDQVNSYFGTSADAWVSEPTGYHLTQVPPITTNVGKQSALQGPKPTLRELVPNLRRSIVMKLSVGDSVSASNPGHASSAYVLGVDYADPLATGLVRQLSGRAPRSVDEIGISSRLATALNAHVGDSMIVAKHAYIVVGFVRFNNDYRASGIVGLPEAFPQIAFTPSMEPNLGPAGVGWLIATTSPVTYREVLNINAQGSTVQSRAVAQHPLTICSPQVPAIYRNCNPASSPTALIATAAALVAVAFALGLLQVVLIVGPAFAIGRRRQARTLALVAAVGGDSRTVRRIVLSGGIVLGLAGGAAGLLIGVSAFVASRPIVTQIAGKDLGVTKLRPELLLLPLVAVATGLFAAWIPARQASRQDVIATLSGRRGAPAPPKSVAWVGVAAVLAGSALALSVRHASADKLTLLLGCALAEVGLIIVTPTVIAFAATRARYFSTAPRFALRDAGRNRVRSGAAAAAVLAAVAAATGVAINTHSQEEVTRAHYAPSVPLGSVYVSPSDYGAKADLRVALAIAKELPTKSLIAMRGAPFAQDQGDCGLGQCVQGWNAQLPRGVDDTCHATNPVALATWPCTSQGSGLWSPWLAGDAQTYFAMTGKTLAPAMSQRLARGDVLVTSDLGHYVDASGHLTLVERTTGKLHVLHAVVLPPGKPWELQSFQLLASPQVFKAIRLPIDAFGTMILTTRMPTETELAQANSVAMVASQATQLIEGVPYSSPGLFPVLLAIVPLLLLAFAGTAIATGLANADAGPDFATLAAIGAGPRTRRRIAASAAATIAVIGTAMGAIAGVVVGIAFVRVATDPTRSGYGIRGFGLPLSIPWSQLLALWVAVPLASVLLAFVFSRSRLPMVQRIS